MNTRQRMYKTNSKIKKYLLELGFIHIYLFPHLRFCKDYILENQGFDALGFKIGDKRVYFFQFKTNKKPNKQTLKEYAMLEEEYFIKCLWVNKTKNEITIN